MERKIAAMHSMFGRRSGFCRDCDNLCKRLRDKVYYKCLAYGVSCSTATDWRVSNPACGMFNTALPADFVPVIERLKHLPRPVTPEPELEGQMNLFDEFIQGGPQ